MENRKSKPSSNHNKPDANREAIITRRPDGMHFAEYRLLRKEQQQRIRDYLAGRPTTACYPSDRRERRERERLQASFDNAQRPYQFHKHRYKRLKRAGLIISNAIP
ncbi:MAG: hypothetical protein LBF90_03185 [Prevotellaceae bacterium]|jgi:hypothetical protein|nr:hypothetical protein [Prevotellaceae bacterium]